MPVTHVEHDLDTRTLTITAEFAAPVEKVWDVYADPRKLEAVWGPPEFPATFVDHELSPGTRSTYFMTGPNGERHCGWWQITAVDAPHSFTFDDGFANEDFTPAEGMPVAENVYTFTESDDAGSHKTTLAVFTATYETAEGLQQVLKMGVVEGASAAINQIDALIAD